MNAAPGLAGKLAVLATMHGKETVIAPTLRDGLGLDVVLAPGLDTDRFGTFTREIGRAGSQMDAARCKALAGFTYVPRASIAIASEGSFVAHPYMPFLPVGIEVVLLVDRQSGLEIAGRDESINTNYSHDVVDSVEAALVFARKAGFPGHGVVVLGSRDGQPVPGLFASKDARDDEALSQAVARAIGLCGQAHVEADMRAHRNPTRMAAIERAARDLVWRFSQRCPRCDHPGFDTVEHISGLPCGLCGLPTRVAKAHVQRCERCRHSLVRLAKRGPVAESMHCDNCNP
jgi:hypothetical protein